MTRTGGPTRRAAALAALATLAALACSPATATSREAANDADPTDTAAPQHPVTNPSAAGPLHEGLVAVELATVGMDPAQQSPVVLLRDPASGKIVPIWVGIAEARAILTVMLGIEMPRPMTHDLLAAVIRELGATLEEVVVHDLQGSTYVGQLRLRVPGEPSLREVDSRPSDALALAIRANAPIRVADALLADPPDFDFLAPEADEQVVRLLGITVVTPTPALRARHQLPDRPGLVVVGVSGEAAERGLRRGDLIIGLDDAVPREPMDFLNAARAAHHVLRIRYWRAGVDEEIQLTPLRIPDAERRRGPAPIQT